MRHPNDPEQYFAGWLIVGSKNKVVWNRMIQPCFGKQRDRFPCEAAEFLLKQSHIVVCGAIGRRYRDFQVQKRGERFLLTIRVATSYRDEREDVTLRLQLVFE